MRYIKYLLSFRELRIQKWIYCEDELPIMGERVLFCVDGFVGEGYVNGEGVWYRVSDYPLHLVFDAEVKKWMPMPKG